MPAFRLALIVILVAASPLLAEEGDFALRLSAQWIERTGTTDPTDFTSGSVLDLDFDAGAGLGVGVEYFLRDRFSVDASAAIARVAEARAVVRRGDGIGILLLGDLDVTFLTVLARYYFARTGRADYSVAAGVSQIFFGDFETQLPEGERLSDETGFAVAVGADYNFSPRWAVIGEVRYVPFSTGAAFDGGEGFEFEPVIVGAGVRYNF